MIFNENLTFNYSDSFIKDVKTIDGIMQKYIQDRKNMYNEVFENGNYTEQDIEDYLAYFTTLSCDMTQDVYPDMYHIHHFLQRDYDIWIYEEVCNLKNQILSLMTDSEVTDNFEDWEFNNLQNLTTTWQDFMNEIASLPLIDLDKMDFENIYGVQCFFDKDTQDFVSETFMNFMEKLHESYPNTLLKLDTVIVVPLDYIQFLGGDDSTQAFFTDNTLFLASSCSNLQSEEEKVFYETVLFHETGHFIFSLLSETSQIYWANLYKDWRAKDVKMTRDEDRNSQLFDEDGNETGEFIEELFADTFATLFIGNKLKDEYYIHKPSALISDSVDFILRKEFN